jgi:23S rRNA (adenine2503-C2)-methyltransferase
LRYYQDPKYRAKQVHNWVRVQGVTDVSQMNNIPKKLKEDLDRFAAVGSLTLDMEQISKDGTTKRAYRLEDGQLIESVLMPYTDGRYTACISSQAGCAQGCVFCATGQMGFSRQLTADEIFEQVARFASELSLQDQQEKKELKNQSKNGKGQTQEHYSRNQQQKTSGRSTRLSNLVFMGMGEVRSLVWSVAVVIAVYVECTSMHQVVFTHSMASLRFPLQPLANYQNVKKAIQRIQSELGIGHRKITVSTVGIVPNIYKMAEELPQVRLAVSLCKKSKHIDCAFSFNCLFLTLDCCLIP